MKSTLMIIYLSVGIVICSWFTAAAAFGWKSPNFGIVKSMNSSGRGGYYGGRSYGGSWGGGK